MSRRNARVATKKERQRKLARDAHPARLERQAQRARRARQWSVSAIVFVVVAAVGVGIAAIGGAFNSAGTKSAERRYHDSVGLRQPDRQPDRRRRRRQHPRHGGRQVHLHRRAAPQPARSRCRRPSRTPPATYTATIKTNRGDIVIDLLNKQAPCTVGSFVSLASQKYFNNTPCPQAQQHPGPVHPAVRRPNGNG